MNSQQKEKLEAATYRRLLSHLQNRTDVQNIDLMNLAGFCRNCLSKWYHAEAEKQEIDFPFDAVRTEVYGMPYDQWKAQYQTEATEVQKREFEQKHSSK